jgi:hypothetical protein
MEKMDSVLQWFPQTEYYHTHSQRFQFSFANLPDLPSGARCLCIGSWGAEAPLLYEVFGASEVMAIRAPEAGVPRVEERSACSPASGKHHRVRIFALDIESDELPEDLCEFDLVLAWEILEHLCVDPSYMIWQSIHAAKIGGFISLTTPNALWHVLTIAQLYGQNSLGLKLQHHLPHATHWRLYTPAEVADLFENMGCIVQKKTTFLDESPFGWKSRMAHAALRYLRRNSNNGKQTLGKHLYVLAQKAHEAPQCRPTWLHPNTDGGGRLAHLQQLVAADV